MAKKQNILEIEMLLLVYYDDVIDDNFVCDVYDENGCKIFNENVQYTEIVRYTNGEIKVWGIDYHKAKNRSFKLNTLPAETVKKIYNGLKTRREGYKQEKVEERTREIAAEIHNRFYSLIEKAFKTEVFDWDDAFQSGYIIPKAIIAAVCETLMDECINSDANIEYEADKIFTCL